MNTPTKTPDLLTPVLEALDKMPGYEKLALAMDMKVSHRTFDKLKDKSRRFGPSYKLVAELYERLVVKTA